MTTDGISKRDGVVWTVLFLIVGAFSVVIGLIVAGVSVPTFGIASGVVAFVGGGLTAMKGANVVFNFVDNVESRFFNEASGVQDSSTIGGVNVTQREEFINEQLDRLDDWFTVFEAQLCTLK